MEEQTIQSWHHVVTIDDLGGLKRKVNVVFDNIGTKDALDKAIDAINKNYMIKGFRKGKAPAHIVMNMYKKTVEEIAKDSLANDGFLHACMEQKLIPMTTPKIDNYKFKLDGSFTCEILVDQKPTINPVGYIGLQLTKPTLNKQEITDNILSDYRSKFTKEVPKDVVELGDIVVVDFSAYDKNSKEISSGKDQKFAINPGMKEPFGENLIGLKIGDVSICDTVLPEGYPERAGEAITVNLNVKAVFKMEAPTNEDLVGKLNLGGIEEFNKAVEYATNREMNKKEREIIEENVVDRLLEMNEFDIPEEWVEEEKNYFFKQIGIDKPDEQLLEYAVGMSRRNVRRTFILDAIYDTEQQLRITNEEIDAVIKSEAEKRGVSTLVIKDEMKKGKMLDALVGAIRNRKVMDFILSQAQFVEEQPMHVDCNCEVPENPLG